jgi:hypothetical protein
MAQITVAYLYTQKKEDEFNSTLPNGSAVTKATKRTCN